MDDLIRRGDAIALCEMAIDDSWEYDYATDRMFEIPAVDAVEGVVRCRDCVHYYDVLRRGTQFESGLCDRWVDGTAFDPDDYCSRGRRREDGANGKHL
jgi:hypothetical protein